ncbi:hypothetical protein JCM8547_006657 [Rhodosporidiobolus lusitaniae]
MASSSPALSSSSRDPHLVALKVLRSTRPSLAPPSAYELPYEDGAASQAFRALEAERGKPESDGSGGGGGLLRVPAEFGVIYLGETFSAVLSLSNDLQPPPSPSTAVLAHSPILKVEIHTSISPQTGQPTNKHLLATVPSAGAGLEPGQSTEAVVAHELKELGQHALVCTVQYGQEVEGGGERRVVSRSFRKVYKFAVSSPLSVRTKAHSPPPSCASSYLSPSQRCLIFLEVQVHNHHVHSLFFERMRFEPLLVPSSTGETALKLADGFADPNEGLFDAEEDALLPPGGVRQFLYVLQQSEEERKKAIPGANQGLGRLDIVWRTPYGEIGRLQSSTLGRRIPAGPTPPTPAPPAPPIGASPALPPLPPMSPPHPQSQLGPAPYRPMPHRTSTPNPDLQQGGPAVPPPPLLPSAEGLSFDFTVDDLPSSTSISVDRPLSLSFCLGISSPLPCLPTHPSAPSPLKRRRRLHLAAQHVQYDPSLLGSSSSSLPLASLTTGTTAKGHGPSQPSVSLSLPGSFSSAPSAPPPAGGVTTLQQQQQLASSAAAGRGSIDSVASSSSLFIAPPTPLSAREQNYLLPKIDGVVLPPPTPFPPSSSAGPMRASGALPSADVVRLGAGVVDLGWVEVEEGNGEKEKEKELRWKFRFVASEGGLKRVGGVRVLLLDTREGEDKVEEEEDGRERTARIVGEWEVVAEVWVESG